MTERPEPQRDLDWESGRARAFTDRTVDLYEELLERLRDLPVTNAVTTGDVRDALAIEIPDEPMPEDELFAYLRDMVFQRSMYPGHPRFMAYVSGAGTVPGAAADLLAAGRNMNAGGWLLSPSASEIERHLTATFSRWFGMPGEAGGILVSGGAMANFVALKVARDRCAGWDVRTEGLAGHPQLTIYLSTETHVVSARGADMLGVGTGSVRSIPVDQRYRIRVDLLREAIRKDRDAGARPIAVVGSAGTVATGAIDPLDALADLCQAEGLWFHVDAAYGGPAAFTEDLAPLFAGIERADSVAFDPHKWLYTRCRADASWCGICSSSRTRSR